jgi:nucleoside-diphosphate-sugar epimerase
VQVVRVLVTGGWGYVGAHVVSELKRKNVLIDLCDIGWFLEAHTTPPPKPLPRDFRMLSIADLTGVDAIIHLAGLSNDPLGSLHASQTNALNHQATLALAHIAKQAGVSRFVFASTCSVYGASGATQLDEFSPTVPITPYGEAKRKAELGLLSMQTAHFKIAILRGATAYGFSPCPRTDLLLNEFCTMAALGRQFSLTSDGASWRPFMPVDLFAKGLVAASLAPPELDDGLPIWNVAPPSHQMTVANAVLRAAQICGSPPPIFGAHLPADQRSYRVDGRRFADAYPNVPYLDDFDAQIVHAASAFSNLPTLAKDLSNRRFIRLHMLKSFKQEQKSNAELFRAV